MSSKPSKRDAERNQRQLQTLADIPENRQCADCNDSKPKWASANIGVFLCIRCAGLHRNMGREISVIKSINLDTWTEKEVETMTNMGNRRANALYLANGPGGPPSPSQKDIAKYYLNAGMVPQGAPSCSDKEMYRFIKDKYKKRIYMRDKDRRELELKESRENRGKSSSSSSSSPNRANSSSIGGSGGSSRQQNVTIEPDDHVTFSGQLKILGSMGFSDTTKCLVALKRSKGGVDAAIELLVSKPDELVAASPSAQAPATQLDQTAKSASTNQDLSKALQMRDVDQAVNILVQLQSTQKAPSPSQQQQVHNPQSSFGLDLLSLNDPAPVVGILNSGASDPFAGFFQSAPPVQQQQQQQQHQQQEFHQYQNANQFGNVQQFAAQPVQQQQAWETQPNQQQLFMQMQPQRAPQQTQFQPQQQMANFGSNPMSQFQPAMIAQPAAFGSQPSQQLQQSAFGSAVQQQQPQQQQTFKPNYNPQVMMNASGSVFTRPQQQPIPQQHQLKNDPFAALVKESNMMPQQPQQSFNVTTVQQQQQVPIGAMMNVNQQRQMGMMGQPMQQQQQQPQYMAYSAIPQQQPAPFGGFGIQQQQPSQVPRSMMPPQQQQQQQMMGIQQQNSMQQLQQPQQQNLNNRFF
ncbi:putative GTPase activating protein for Arf-domain-containing protein [Obelidium mucronatum]|nr:putative GTPase activating protein for Arf-domain-containing protein [Obelidium mucronatum]